MFFLSLYDLFACSPHLFILHWFFYFCFIRILLCVDFYGNNLTLHSVHNPVYCYTFLRLLCCLFVIVMSKFVVSVVSLRPRDNHVTCFSCSRCMLFSLYLCLGAIFAESGIDLFGLVSKQRTYMGRTKSTNEKKRDKGASLAQDTVKPAVEGSGDIRYFGSGASGEVPRRSEKILWLTITGQRRQLLTDQVSLLPLRT